MVQFATTLQAVNQHGVTKSVRVTRMCVEVILEKREDGGYRSYGDVEIYFDTSDWSIDNDGLLYHSRGVFWDQLSAHLRAIGFTSSASKDVHGSEQGMQGDDYLSCDSSGFEGRFGLEAIFLAGKIEGIELSTTPDVEQYHDVY
jgi:hypothetical protein